MAKCIVCGKGPRVGNSVSHANNRIKRRWLPNIQKIRIQWDGKAQTAPVCAQCLRSGRVVKVVRGAQAQRTESPANA